MTCNQCKTHNPPEAQFCKNCGAPLKLSPVQNGSDAQTIKSLLIIMGIDYLISTIMFIMQRFILPPLYNSGDTNTISLIYEYFGWATDIILIGVMIFFLAMIQNKNVKIALVVFITLRVIFLIGYRLLNHSF